MRARRLLLAVAAAGLAAGCRFAPAVVASDGGPDDGGRDARGEGGADAPGDAGLDAAPTACVVTAGPAQPGTTMGGAGGAPVPELACPAGEVPIGVAFDMTANPISNHGGQPVAARTHLRCGRVERSSSGALTTTPTGVVTQPGDLGGNCGAYHPQVATEEATCPPWSVLIAMTANVSGGDPARGMVNDVSLVCARLSAAAEITQTTMVIHVNGSGTAADLASTAGCAAGLALVGLAPRVGCGQDALAARCAALACE